MKTLSKFALTLVLLLGLVAPVAAQAPFTPEIKKEVTDIATKLRGGGKDALMKYKPTAAQIEKIAATPDDAKALTAYVESMFASIPANGLAAKDGQTEIIVSNELPGGYARTTSKFKPGVAIYAFKFVKPGETLGMAFDGLMKVDGAWVMIPKAWRAFDAAK
ncbi:MAG: hypothetical protein JSR82_23350 [Verrucomicrobia bacterium]|nr:hypothetical protein [Verrucomicrobiota bacterium]